MVAPWGMRLRRLGEGYEGALRPCREGWDEVVVSGEAEGMGVGLGGGGACRKLIFDVV